MAGRGRKRLLEVQPEIGQRIVDYIAAGLTDEMAYSQAGVGKDTFYRELKRSSEFCEAVSRARAKAKVLAVVAFKSGLVKNTTTETTTDSFTETHIGKDGKPYEYKRSTVTHKVIEHLPDWRAGEAWLKRRDAANWSDKILVGVDTRQLELLLGLMRQVNLKPSDVFESMIQKLSRNLEH